jgi:esterase/lipase superfamily enzyme
MPDRRVERFPARELGQEMRIARWGHYGTPVLLFPPAGGDAEEPERHGVVDAAGDLLASGRAKLYSVGGPVERAVLGRTTAEEERAELARRFERFLMDVAIPFIREDCNSPEIEIVTAGPSMGARHAVAALIRHPDVVRTAIGMSGRYDESDEESSRSFERPSGRDVVPLPVGRMVILAHGAGRWERPQSSQRMARLLEQHGVPHRVEDWGSRWDHDWTTWRAMLPKYLEETT